MTTRSKGPGAGFGWLNRGLRMMFRYPRPVFGGGAFILVFMLIPLLAVQLIQVSALHSGRPLEASFFFWMMGISALLGLLVIPLYAGFLQMLDGAERGLPARAVDVFRPYREARETGRLMGFGIVYLVLYNALAAVIIVATGGGVGRWYLQLLTAQAHHQPPPSSLPPEFGVTLALFLVLLLFLMGFYAISLGQVALRRRSVFGAVGDGLVGALKNVLPLVVFALSALLASIVAALALLVVGIVIGLIGAIAGHVAVLVLAIPLYIALMLVLVAIMLGVTYALWRDVCGDETIADGSPSIAV